MQINFQGSNSCDHDHAMSNLDFDNLIFSGGGLRGLVAFSAAVQELSKNFDLTQLKRVGGVSAGAIIALELCVGGDGSKVAEVMTRLTSKELFERVSEFQKYCHTLYQYLRSYVEHWVRLNGGLDGMEAINFWFAKKIDYALTLLKRIHHLIFRSGISDGYLVEELLERTLFEATERHNLTFAELHELVLEDPETYSDLYLVVRNVDKGIAGEPETWSHEIDHTALYEYWNFPMSAAVAASACQPCVFIPKRLTTKDGKWVHIIDGGVLSNYPFYLFDKYKYHADAENHRYPNRTHFNYKTLCFRLDDKKTLKHLIERTHVVKQREYIPLWITLWRFVKLHIVGETELLLGKNQENHDRTVYIITNFGGYDFNMTDQKRAVLRAAGITGMQVFIKCRLDESTPCLSEMIAARPHSLEIECEEKKQSDDNEANQVNHSSQTLRERFTRTFLYVWLSSKKETPSSENTDPAVLSAQHANVINFMEHREQLMDDEKTATELSDPAHHYARSKQD